MSAHRAALLQAFRRRFGRPPRLIAEAPGRVNLIGEHTDYNEGHVLPVAIDRTVAVAAAEGESGVRAYSLDYDEEDGFDAADVAAASEAGWRNYVRGVVWAMAEAGLQPPAAELAIAGDVPVGAGLSSSAAVEVAVGAALAAVGGMSVPPRELALLAHRAESAFVGVQCGVMDQLAAVFGREGHALLIDCRGLKVEPVPLGLAELGLGLVIVDSGVRRSLEGSPYNLRRHECEQAAAALGVRALRDVTVESLESRAGEMPPRLYRRARHVAAEEGRVAAAVEALRRGDAEELGRLLYESHESLRDDFGVSCDELDLLVELAGGVEGVLGARLTGAGFGGCTVNLVRLAALDSFRRDALDTYRGRTGLDAEMYVVRPSGGLRVSDV